jgi:orotate phosphoribosyltransferase
LEEVLQEQVILLPLIKDVLRSFVNMEKNQLAIEVAKNLLKIKAVFLKPNDPFTWASGIKSPIYCDNRLTLSYPETRKVVEDGLALVIKTYFPTCEVVMGTSTAGIAHAAYVSDILNLPMGYVRGGAKDHGRGNQIEGVVPVGKDVVVIEDLISTGGSSIEVVEVLREAGCNVLGIASIFTYNLQKGLDKLASANVINHSLSNFETLVQVAADENYISEDDINKILKFQKNPSDPSWME